MASNHHVTKMVSVRIVANAVIAQALGLGRASMALGIVVPAVIGGCSDGKWLYGTGSSDGSPEEGGAKTAGIGGKESSGGAAVVARGGGMTATGGRGTTTLGSSGGNRFAIGIGGSLARGGATTTTSTGSASARGGATIAGGAAATISKGGASTAAGASARGGATITGGATSHAGGTSTTGGATSTGGAVTPPSNGGASGRGGASATGGTVAVGGSSTTGGTYVALSKGGVTATGGSIATGGLLATGGTTTTQSTGGTLGTSGPVSSGGAAPATGAPSTAIQRACKGGDLICQNESCCTTIEMVGGMFWMGRSQTQSTEPQENDYDPVQAYYSTPETPQHDATVAPFSLDKYEVTVGRFRQFVDSYDNWIRDNPKKGAGALALAANTGWGESWNAAPTDVPADATTLKEGLKPNSAYCNWTDTEGTTQAEAYPMNCVTWFESYAFCLWDEGRLPTEAEWEYAAAGAKENRIYPWVSKDIDATRANYAESDDSPKIGVGSHSEGASAFGHQDLAGSMEEWVFDWYAAKYYADGPPSCDNCANATEDVARAIRGGSWRSLPTGLRAAGRGGKRPDSGLVSTGIRCARPLRFP